MTILEKLTYLVFACLSLFLVFNTDMQENSKYKLPELYRDNGDGFIVIAHRGASAYYPENTMAAFKGALEMEAEMIELDVMLSKDGVPVVFHDATLEDHSTGSGRLADYTLSQLQELDAGSWFDSSFAGQKIPTLEEVLAFASGKIALNIEIKTEAVSDEVMGGVEEKSLELVKKYNMEDYVLFSSFDYRAIAHLKALDPDMPAAILYEKSQSEKLLPSELLAKYQADAFNCSYRELNTRRFKDIRENNIPVFIYTVDKPSKMRKLLRMNVSGIFTNKPDVLWNVLD